MSMESYQTVDLRIYDLCRTRLQLSEGDAATVSQELQGFLDEERATHLKAYLEADSAARRDFEDFIETRIEFIRKDIDHKHEHIASKLHKSGRPSAYFSDIMQWMFTYFAFMMGGIVAILLLLLKK